MTKEELKQQFYKYIKDHEDYFDPREPWTERIILQIWLDCAEPREKRITELEDKLANADYQLEGRDLEIKELEKENTELKTDMATAIPLLERAKEISESLTKAKDLLLKVADVCGYPNYDIPVELYADIEHFISEVEK